MLLHRTRLELYCEILELIRNGCNKASSICFHMNTNRNLTERSLSSLETQKLIKPMSDFESERFSSVTNYELTSKGENVINYFMKELDIFNSA